VPLDCLLKSQRSFSEGVVGLGTYAGEAAKCGDGDESVCMGGVVQSKRKRGWSLSA
jgi:hypothetical protein